MDHGRFKIEIEGKAGLLQCSGVTRWNDANNLWQAEIVAQNSPLITFTAESDFHDQAALLCALRYVRGESDQR